MRHCLVMADKVAKLPSLVNNLITNQGVTLFSSFYFLPLFFFLVEHKAQVLNYLNASGLKLGILVNFGHYLKLEYERFVLTREKENL